MKIAIIGSRGICHIDLSLYLDSGISEIISGGAIGVDSVAKDYSLAKNIKYTEFTPDYSRYGKAAPILRNKQIVDYSDFILIFWYGSSRGTRSVIDYCKKVGKKHRIVLLD